MKNDFKIFGAKASVYLKYDGEMINLAKELSKGLMLHEFYFENDEDEPYEIFGMCEAMGFELWLRNSTFKDFSFLIEIATGHSLKEIGSDRMYDLSPWLARYIAEVCDIESYVFNLDNQEGVLFKNK